MDDLDRAKAAEMRHRDKALLAQQQRAKETEQPLMVNGRRLCLGCGEEIRAKRLIARPESVRCIDCKTKQEQRENKNG